MDALNAHQSAAADKFAVVLTAAITGGDDVRGMLLARVATNLRKQGQHYTAALMQRAADCYEGKS